LYDHFLKNLIIWTFLLLQTFIYVKDQWLMYYLNGTVVAEPLNLDVRDGKIYLWFELKL